MDFRKKGYFHYINSMASRVNLSPEGVYYMKIASEISNRQSRDDLDKLIEEARERLKNGEGDWGFKEPVY